MQHPITPMAADGSSSPQPELGDVVLDTAKCGVVLIGHGNTASTLLEAARAIIPGDGLADVVALDAGLGQTPALRELVCAAIREVDEGRGILLLADLMGSSPCMCGIKESYGHGIAVVAGLNLAMLTKLAVIDRRSSPRDLAEACADSARRSISVKASDSQTSCSAVPEAE